MIMMCDPVLDIRISCCYEKGHLIFTVKVKAIPVHASTGSEFSRSLRLPDFKTFGT